MLSRKRQSALVIYIFYSMVRYKKSLTGFMSCGSMVKVMVISNASGT